MFTQIATMHYAVIVAIREWKNYKIKSKRLDFTHFSTKCNFFICTDVKMQICKQKNNNGTLVAENIGYFCK